MTRSAWSGKTCDLSWLNVSPGEKALSCGVDDAWMHRQELESLYRKGSMSCLYHHHTRGSSDVGIAGIFLYNSISCWSLVGNETTLLESAQPFRALSSASKSSSSADNRGLLQNVACQMKLNRISQQKILGYVLQNVQITSSRCSESCCSATASLDICR